MSFYVGWWGKDKTGYKDVWEYLLRCCLTVYDVRSIFYYT